MTARPATALYHEAADHVLTICAAGSPTWGATVGWAALRSMPDDLARDVIESDAELRGAGPPIPAFIGVMAEASFWADMASPAELGVYCLATFNRMLPHRQATFLAFAQREVVT